MEVIMTNYIPAKKLKAKIQKLQSLNRYYELARKDVLDIIDSLQQEQSEMKLKVSEFSQPIPKNIADCVGEHYWEMLGEEEKGGYKGNKTTQQEQPEESIVKEAIQLVFEEKLTPFKDGNQWCFLLGHNIQEGICGFGDTIFDAAISFYKDYSTTRIHIGELKKIMEQPEVDLEEEIEKYCGNRNVRPVPDLMEQVARHFAEWGAIHLNARK